MTKRCYQCVCFTVCEIETKMRAVIDRMDELDVLSVSCSQSTDIIDETLAKLCNNFTEESK